jgi:hypothetical protein
MILDELICAWFLNVRWNQNPATSFVNRWTYHLERLP